MLNVTRKLLVFLFGKLNKRHAGIVAGNLQIAFPNQSQKERAILVQKIYHHFSEVFVAVIHIFVKQKPEKIIKPIEIKHLEYLEQALEKKKGVILFSAHFGNWELVPFILNRRLGVTLNSIARKMDNPLVEKKVLEFRKFMGSSVIDKANAARTMLKCLEKNGIVYLLIDQNTIEREGVYVEFFGRTVTAVPSVSQLHLKRNIPVLPLFLHYEADRFVLEFQPELDAAAILAGHDSAGKKGAAGNKNENIRRLTQWSTTVIENQIRKHPEQWFWFHNRWKNSPSLYVQKEELKKTQEKTQEKEQEKTQEKTQEKIQLTKKKKKTDDVKIKNDY